MFFVSHFMCARARTRVRTKRMWIYIYIYIYIYILRETLENHHPSFPESFRCPFLGHLRPRLRSTKLIDAPKEESPMQQGRVARVNASTRKRRFDLSTWRSTRQMKKRQRFLWISVVRSSVSSYAETRNRSVNYRLKIRPIAGTRPGGGAPRFKMKNRGNDVFSKVRSNAPPPQPRKEQGGRRAHRVYNTRRCR